MLAISQIDILISIVRLRRIQTMRPTSGRSTLQAPIDPCVRAFGPRLALCFAPHLLWARAKIWTADRDSGLRRGLTRDRLA
jgi:hypothetical protein